MSVDIVGQYMRQDARYQYSHVYQNQMVPSIKQEYIWSDCSESSLNDSWSSEYRGGLNMGVSRSLQSSPTDLSFPQSEVKPSNFPAMVGYSGKNSIGCLFDSSKMLNILTSRTLTK